MEAPLLFIAFPSLLQGAPKILVGGRAEAQCLPARGWARGRSSALVSPMAVGAALRPRMDHNRLVYPDPKRWKSSVAFHQGWLGKPYPQLLAYQTLCWK